MKLILTFVVLCYLAICSCWPVNDDGYKNTLEAIDGAIRGDTDNVEHLRLARQYFGGFGFPGGYGGYGGFPYGGGGGFSNSQASASASSQGGGFGYYG
ncbi:glycine-rich RNA-binding protein blt801-like [Lucilia cuprina]|uniref:glycine-rich RNA-binding protein blt801-like n=1 Tax=Lucilia cuprina TaxID=7375 RepID=UPI001F058AAF|nr:glycine-rich RNA-binding protein blt801-like [Lucilia cuprina]